jgi:hypothetical protein
MRPIGSPAGLSNPFFSLKSTKQKRDGKSAELVKSSDFYGSIIITTKSRHIKIGLKME